MTITVTEEEFQCDSDCLCQPRKNTTGRGLKKKIIFRGGSNFFNCLWQEARGGHLFNEDEEDIERYIDDDDDFVDNVRFQDEQV